MAEKHSARPNLSSWLPLVLAIVILAIGAVYYGDRLTQWQAYDDEGGYLYAAWRISLGEAPYRDFLTPQLPVFLYPGALVLALWDYSVLAARLYMVALTLASAAMLFLALRRLWGGWPALLALALLVPQQEYFWAARFFRPEAPMLFWATLGLWLLIIGYPQRRRLPLALAGLALGLSVMSKLFGALTTVGVALFLLVEGLRSRDWRDMLITGLWVGLPFLLCVGGFTLAFMLVSPEFIADVLGHHVRQGSGTPLLVVIQKTLALYRDYVREQPLYVGLALAGLLIGLRRPKHLATLFLTQVATVLAFFLMTRDLQARHLTFVVPSLAAGGGYALWTLWEALAARRWSLWRAAAAVFLGAGLGILALRPHVARNAWVASWAENETSVWADYLQRHTAPGEYILSDYPGLNFAAQRPTTPLAAGLSRGATKSGQIMGAALIDEIERYDVRMVLLNVAQGAHQLVYLTDYDRFKAYVQQHFYLAERRIYDYRLVEVYARADLFPGQPMHADLGHRLALAGVRWIAQEARPGDQLQVEMRWQGLAPMDEDYRVTLRLMDAFGHEWGLGSKMLADVDAETYWDLQGLEQAVLIPTSQWPVFETTLQVFELPVDLATPPGTYQVLARVHPEGAWAGLPSLDGSGKVLGYDVVLGEARILPATEAPAAEALKIEHLLDITVSEGLRLLGLSHVSEEVRPGDQLGLALYWRAEADLAALPEVRFDLVGAEGILTAARWPMFPTPVETWSAGQVLRGQYAVPIPAEAPSGSYRVMLALGEETEPVADLGTIQVSGRQRLFDAPPLARRVEARYGGALTLLGYELPDASATPGGSLELTLVWRCEQPMEVAYTVFVHLTDETHQVWGQRDAQPQDGQAPTTGWVPGEVIVDRYAVAIKPDAPAGSYRLAVGLYDATTGVRLEGEDASGQPLDQDRALLEDGVTLR